MLRKIEAFTILGLTEVFLQFVTKINAINWKARESVPTVTPPIWNLLAGARSPHVYFTHIFFLLFPREICVMKKNKNTLAATKAYHCNTRPSLASACVILPFRLQLLFASYRQKNNTHPPLQKRKNIRALPLNQHNKNHICFLPCKISYE